MESLFGRRTVVASYDLQSQLTALSDRVDPRLGIDPERLMMRHTLFPYYTAFQPSEVRNKAAADLLGSGTASIHVRLGIATFSIQRPRRLRYCPDCVEVAVSEDRDATWLRGHQLPGNIVCHVHGTILIDGAVEIDGLNRHAFSHLDTSSSAVIAPSLPEKTGDLLKCIARAQHCLCASIRPVRELDDWKGHYRERLASVGLMRSACKVDHAGLEEALRDVLGPALPFLPAACSSFGEHGWAALMVRYHRKAMHPLFHVLMDFALERLAPVDEPIAPKTSKGAMDASGRHPAALGREARTDWSAIDRRLVIKLRHVRRKIASATPPERLSFASLERGAAGPGWIRKRANRLPLAVAALTTMTETDEAFADRRIAYWTERLFDVPTWQILKAAGIRSDAWSSYTANVEYHRRADRAGRAA